MKENNIYKKIAFSALFLILILNITYSINVTSLFEEIEGGHNEVFEGGFFWFSNWRLIAIIVIFITLACVLIAYMVGKSFNLPQLKAWADVEMGQIFASIILLIALIAIIGFIDVFATNLTNSFLEGSVDGDLPEDSLELSKYYVESLSNLTDKNLKTIFNSNIEIAREASEREGKTCQSIFCLYFGWYGSPNSGKSILVEKNSMLIEYLTTIQFSLKAQYWFLETIGIAIGPLFLIIGIVLRSFFITRKIGGLFLSLGIGILVALPLLYLFMWWTLTIQTYGTEILSPNIDCPDECLLPAPYAYNVLTNEAYSVNELYDWNRNLERLIELRETEEISITPEAWAELMELNSSIIGCDDICGSCEVSNTQEMCELKTDCLWDMSLGDCNLNIDHCRNLDEDACVDGCDWRLENVWKCVPTCGDYTDQSTCESTDDICRWDPGKCVGTKNSCDIACRELPLFPSMCNCDEEACEECPDACKVIRERTDCEDECPVELCPDECKINYTNAIEEDCTTCIGCPTHCRYEYADGTQLYDECNQDACDTYGECAGCECNIEECYDCECKIVLPDPGRINCESVCEDCPEYCRVVNTTLRECDTTECNACPNYCKIDFSLSSSDCGPVWTGSPEQFANCNSCLDSCRMTGLASVMEIPAICNTELMQQACTSPNCRTSCMITDIPPICKSYDSSDTTGENCALCPEECRIELESPEGIVGIGIDDCRSTNCADGDCNSECKKIEEIPINSNCLAYNPTSSENDKCQQCEYECRFFGSLLSPHSDCLSTACNETNCPNECKIDISEGGQICEIYNESSSTSNNCALCPEFCRLNGGSTFCDLLEDEYSCSTLDCPNECKVDIPYSSECQPFNFEGCFGCPPECRVDSASRPVECYDYDMFCNTLPNPFSCSTDCQVEVPENACSNCLYCPSDCTALPPIRKDCSEVCSVSGYYSLKLSSMIGNLGAGSEGYQDVKNVAVLFVPAFILPILIVIILLSFIVVLSKSLGGDYEIPGISKYL